MNPSETTRKRGWPSCCIDSPKLEMLLQKQGRPMRWLWSGDGPGRVDAKTGLRIEQGQEVSIRTIFRIASRLNCDPRDLVSDADAHMVIEIARGQIKIADPVGLWGGDPAGAYTAEKYEKVKSANGYDHEHETAFTPDDVNFEFEGFTSKQFIPVDAYGPDNTVAALVLTPEWAKTIAKKSNAYDLASLLTRNAKAPDCDPDKQRISLSTEPLVYVHDVDAHKEVTTRLVDLFRLSQKAIDGQRTLPTVSEIEEHEKARSELQDHLNWLATRNIQILDTCLATDFVLVTDDDQEVFASFVRPLLVLAPTTLVDIEVEYPRFCLEHGQLWGQE